MASGPSTALRTFRQALDQANALMRVERSMFHDPPRPHEQSAVNGLRAGALVLMVAAFEAFLRDLFEERVDEFANSKKAIRFQDLPEKMRIAAVYNTLRHAMDGVPGSPSRKQLDRIPDIVAAAQNVASNRLLGSSFSVTWGNPNPDRVKALFADVGRTAVFDEVRERFEKKWGAPVSRNFLSDYLKDIVDTRHKVAHGVSALGWSREDLRRAQRFLRHLASTLDDDLRMHLNKYRPR